MITLFLMPVLTGAAALTVSESAQLTTHAAAPRYEVREIGRSTWGLTIPNDINNRGVIVGDWDSGDSFGGPRHAVVWIHDEMIDLTPSDTIVYSSARSLNDRGLVTGYFLTDGSAPAGGFRWKRGVFDILPTFAEGHQTGYGVSESGWIVGRAMHEHFSTNPTVWDRDLNDLDLGSLGQGLGLAYDANGWDVIVGASSLNLDQTNAFLWRNGEMHDLGALPGYPIARAYAVNNDNEVVGYSGDVFDDHAFHWSASRGMVDLGNLGYPHGSSANDINDEGVIVGFSYGPHGQTAAVWHEFELFALESLLVDAQGWNLWTAEGINELGQIVGTGRRDGHPVAYLATPVDTPMTTVLGPTPARAGGTSEIEIVEAKPDSNVRVFYGTANGSSLVGECTGASVDIASPRSVVVRADANGHATARIFLPEALRGKRLLVQAVDLSTCDVTNRIVRLLD